VITCPGYKEEKIMNNVLERVAYLRGLSDGLALESDTKESKLILEMIEVMSEMAQSLQELSEEMAEIDDYVELIDEDLDELEDFIYDFEEDEDEAYDFEEIECPYCGEIIEIDKNLFEEGECETEMVCPNCKETFIVDNDECDE